MQAFTCYAVQKGATLIPVTRWGQKPNVDQFVGEHSGLVDVSMLAAMKEKPVASFSSPAIVTALGIAGLSGAEITTEGSPPQTLKFWSQKLQDSGGRASGSVHEIVTVNKGLLLPTRVGASEGQAAAIEYDTYCVTDGTNAPILYSQGALAGTFAASYDYFTLGPVDINGTRYEVQSWDLTFGMEAFVLSHSGLVWPTGASIMKRRPGLRLTTFDQSLARTLGSFGAVTSLVAFLRKCTSAGTVDEATEEHVSFTATTGMSVIETQEVPDAKPGQTDFIIPLAWDGTNNVVVIDTTAAITPEA